MSNWKWVVLAIAMAGLGGYACGSDDDGDGAGGAGGGKGTEVGMNGVCATDPNGTECTACKQAIGTCSLGVCANPMGEVLACAMAKCSDGSDPQCSACSSEQMAYLNCLQSDCPEADPCL